MPRHPIALHCLTVSLLTVILAACGASTQPTPAATIFIPEQKLPIATASIPTTTSPVPTVTAVRTPPPLPDVFVSEYLNANDTPHTYIQDPCKYLNNRWDQNNAAPGTLVIIVMLNDINRGSKPNSTDSITVNQFGRLLENIKEQGFEAINSEQLADFLESNKYIPPRSVLFVQDGRRTAENFNKHFRPLWEESNWPVVNAWIIQENTTEALWQENLALEQEGFVDHQLYSPLQRFSESASEGYLSSELKKYMDKFKEQYNKAPIAIIWPGKPGLNFTRAARGLGFRLGFTANARGPVMYNWIPLADHEDTARPAFYPEGAFRDPLLTLPRYWPSQVVEALDQVRLTGKDAFQFAEQNQDLELEYYDIVCASSYGPITVKQ